MPYLAISLLASSLRSTSLERVCSDIVLSLLQMKVCGPVLSLAPLVLVTSPLDGLGRDFLGNAGQRSLDRLWRSIPSRRSCSAKRFAARCIGGPGLYDLVGTAFIVHVGSLSRSSTLVLMRCRSAAYSGPDPSRCMNSATLRSVWWPPEASFALCRTNARLLMASWIS